MLRDESVGWFRSVLRFYQALQRELAGDLDGDVSRQIQKINAVRDAVRLRLRRERRGDDGERYIGFQGFHALNPRTNLRQHLGGRSLFDFT